MVFLLFSLHVNFSYVDENGAVALNVENDMWRKGDKKSGDDRKKYVKTKQRNGHFEPTW